MARYRSAAHPGRARFAGFPFPWMRIGNKLVVQYADDSAGGTGLHVGGHYPAEETVSSGTD